MANAKHNLINSAYTSQMDSTNGLLEEKRISDQFYRKNGDVLLAASATEYQEA